MSPRSSHGQERGCAVVIPVYNSQATLPTLVDRLTAVWPGVAARFEVVLVNNGTVTSPGRRSAR
jgi:hypothetical protein